ncbi:putative penicillin-binding protein [Sphingomonas changbaiensis NBRC 104936]|uniref:Penicillin-binding protein 1A n=1 Tax=Sphingomonas changbaiensis NBRC 104936 TaxID=1219043 RepID=A0A0E9MTR8_9SPHN|nr:PBP1A family penicillin-binding protein [Sphingomonas changbaiensis]GAO40836.1 putative penicillin-binding protein [Sphingomonas changbaiensis NBRC 104936]
MEQSETAGSRFTLKRAGDYRQKLSELWARRWFRWIAYAAGLLLLGYALIWVMFARDLPSVDKLRTYQPPLPTNVRAIDGTPIHSYARERRVQLSYPEFPQKLVQAYISAEDRTFFSHGGVDYPGIVSAVIKNLTHRGRPVGASTITQQVAKNLLLGNELSYKRKVREALLAYRIEDALTKQQILELYLNQIFLGRNAYGVQAASRAYFDKDVAELTLPQMAYLAILPKGPSNYDPERHEDRALARRNWVLGEMLRNGFISKAEHDAAVASPLGTVPRQGTRFEANAGYFLEEVRRELIDRFGENAEAGPNSLYAGGLWVRTSLDPRLQQLSETALRDGLVRYDRGKGWHGPIKKLPIDGNWAQRLAAANLGAGYANWHVAIVLEKTGGEAKIGFQSGETGTMPASAASIPVAGKGGTTFDALNPGDVIAVEQEGSTWSLRSIPAVSGAMVVENPHNGRIMAMQGGWDSRIHSFNNATQALRQPGSTIKPFVYAAALDNGMTPATLIVDGPFCVYQSALLGQKCFRNFSGGYAGPQTLRWAIEQSRNLMTVRTASQTGMDNVVRTIARMGIGNYKPFLSIALGAGETTALKMTNAVSQLVALGRELKPTLIDYVQDRNGKVIYRTDGRCALMRTCNAKDWDGKPMPRPPLRGRQLMDPMTAYQIVHIMEGVVLRGTAQTLRELDRPLIGKTGTTSGPTNVWFIGGSPDLIAGTYVGYDQPRAMGGYAQGGTLAAPIFKQFAREALKDMPVVSFRAAPGIRFVRIDRRSGRKVFGTFPSLTEPKPAVIWEAFKPESEPRRTIRREEIAARPKEKQLPPDVPVRQGPRDSEFLEREGGIY